MGNVKFFAIDDRNVWKSDSKDEQQQQGKVKLIVIDDGRDDVRTPDWEVADSLVDDDRDDVWKPDWEVADGLASLSPSPRTGHPTATQEYLAQHSTLQILKKIKK